MEKEKSKVNNDGQENEEYKEDEKEEAPARKKKSICKKILRNVLVLSLFLF